MKTFLPIFTSSSKLFTKLSEILNADQFDLREITVHSSDDEEMLATSKQIIVDVDVENAQTLIECEKLVAKFPNKVICLINNREHQLKEKVYNLRVRDVLSKPLIASEILYKITPIEEIKDENILEAQQLYKLFFEQASVGVAQVDENGRFLQVNTQLKELLGYSDEEITKLTYTDLTHPDERSKDKSMLKQVLQEKVSNFKMEKRYQHKKGHYIWFRIYVKTIRNAKGEFLYSITVFNDIDRQKHLEIELSTITSALDNSLNAFNIIDGKGCFTYVNKAYLTWWGYQSKEEIIGTSAATHSVDPEKPREIMESVDANGSCIIEFEAKRKDGSVFEIIMFVQKDTDASGKVIYPCSSLDISEKKKFDKNMLVREEQFKLAMQATSDGIFDWNLKTNEVYYSPGWKKMLGYKNDELPNDFSVWETLTHPDDVKESQKKLNDHIDGKTERYEMEFRMKHKNGKWVNILSRASAIHNSKGKAVRIIGTHINITQRKLNEEALKLSENRFRTLAENVQGAIYLCKNDSKSTVIYLNDKVEQITGYSSKLFLSHKLNFSDLYHPSDAETTQRIIHQSVAKHVPFRITYRIKHKDNSWRWIEESGSGILNQHKVDSRTGIFTDVTETKLKERVKDAQMRLIEKSTALSLNDLLTTFLDEAEALTDSKIGYCYFLEADRKTLSLQALSTNNNMGFRDFTVESNRYSVDEAAVWLECVKTKKPISYNNYKPMSGRRAIPNGYVSINRELVVPVIRENKIIAIVGVANKNTSYTAQDMNSVREFADLAWEMIVRKQTEDLIQAERSRLNSIVQGTMSGTFSWNIETNEIIINERWAEIIGYTIGELEPINYKTWRDSLHPDDIAYCEESIRKYISNEIELYDVEFRQRHKAGHFVWINARGSVTEWTTNERPLLFNGIHLDISERKNAEHALEDSYTKYKTIADYTYDWEYWRGTRDNYIYISPSCERISGYRVEEFITDSHLFESIIHQEDKEIWNQHFQLADKKHTCAETTQFRIHHKNGDVVWIDHVCQPVFDANGKFIGNRGTNRDVTDQRLSQLRVIESEKRFKNLAELAFEGLIIHKDGVIIDVNSACEKLVGYTKDELLGENSFIKLVPEYYYNLVTENMTKDESTISEIELKRKDGTLIPIELMVRYISKVENLMVVAIRDITEQKELQQRILNTIITTEEAERKRVAQDLHDGLGPQLSTIKLYTQTYFNTTKPSLKSKIEKQLLNSIQDALIQVSTISNNLSPHILTDFGLKVSIQKLIERYAAIFNANFIFNYHLKEGLKSSVEITLYRVSIELINNTVKHTKANEVKLEMHSVNDTVVLWYSDNGQGFDFEKTKRLKKGMGLFNITNRIASFNGSVNFQDIKPNGIFYEIEIPLAFNN